MTGSATQPDAIELYLMHLNAALMGVPRPERDEFLKEIRAHIFEKLEQGPPDVAAVLQVLGGPEELAQQFRAECNLAQSARSWSPWVLMKTSARWGLNGFQGFVMFFVALIGYLLAAAFYITAVLKPIYPHNIGFFLNSYCLTLANWPAPQGREVLAPYYTLIAMLLGFLLVGGTSFVLRKMMRKFATARKWLT